MTRVTRVEEGGNGPIGSSAEIEYDISPDAWYFLETDTAPCLRRY